MENPLRVPPDIKRTPPPRTVGLEIDASRLRQTNCLPVLRTEDGSAVFTEGCLRIVANSCNCVYNIRSRTPNLRSLVFFSNS